jgi:hypothetical protein
VVARLMKQLQSHQKLEAGQAKELVGQRIRVLRGEQGWQAGTITVSWLQVSMGSTGFRRGTACSCFLSCRG